MPAAETLQFLRRLLDLAHAIDVRSKKMARTLGVTAPQRIVIRMIGQSPGANASQIATALNMHPSTLTGIVARLQKQGMITRNIDDDDRRRSRFWLTPKGARIDRDRKGTIEAAVRRALARADDTVVGNTTQMIDLLVAELARER